jgi:NAD(P)-dependent dehydrogenase (short-subunit alcohol dehydrogenase family)
VQSTFAAVTEALGGLDVLLHAAGCGRVHPESLTEDELDFLIATNLKATVFANQAALEHMKERGGAIINLGSSEGVNANPGAPHYSATKAAVHAWTRACAQLGSLRRHGQRSPAVETPGADRLREHVGEGGGHDGDAAQRHDADRGQARARQAR